MSSKNHSISDSLSKEERTRESIAFSASLFQKLLEIPVNFSQSVRACPNCSNINSFLFSRQGKHTACLVCRKVFSYE